MAFILPILLVAALGLWFLADLKFEDNWRRERDKLAAAGRWEALNICFEQHLKCRRPLLLIFDSLMAPGTIEADYSKYLCHQEQYEKALQWIDRAAKKAARRSKRLSGIYVIRARILMESGRYEDARKTIAQAKALNAHAPTAGLMEAMVDTYNGWLDSALTRIRESMSNLVCYESACSMASNVLSLQGRFQEAVNVSFHETPDVSTYFSPKELKTLMQDPNGKQRIAELNQNFVNTTRQSLRLGVALACLEAGDAANLDLALNKLELVMQPNPGIEHIYRRLLACNCALKGDAQGTESNLSKARELVKTWPSRSAKYETHLSAGRACLALGQTSFALLELQRAIQLAFHPIEKHTTTYWLARAVEAANQPEEATRHYNTVIAQNFPTWMTTDARQRLDPTAPKSTTAPLQLL